MSASRFKTLHESGWIRSIRRLDGHSFLIEVASGKGDIAEIVVSTKPILPPGSRNPRKASIGNQRLDGDELEPVERQG
jgi:hypothetical protein